MALGFVSLVGAGPGHPDHLTQKAVRRLREADVVLHDALVSKEVREIASQALMIGVGKRAGKEQTPQREIERLLVEAARQGLKVVRLKGGDPFVFGRGGEEALALQDAGIPFEIVPGVTSAIAAPALAGIPVTHRGVSPGFVVLNGSDLDAVDRVVSSIAPRSLTIVVLMGIGPRASIAARLIARGWDAATPAAIVMGAATDEMWSWRGELSQLSTAPVPHGTSRRLPDAPGTIVVGDVVGLPIAISEWSVEHVRA
jgi:uroporphyrin-III C-methyltransferase/precorrin-2 dehydrogenase/sirohydrochlorin ferrochelatase